MGIEQLQVLPVRGEEGMRAGSVIQIGFCNRTFERGNFQFKSALPRRGEAAAPGKARGVRDSGVDGLAIRPPKPRPTCNCDRRGTYNPSPRYLSGPPAQTSKRE